MLGLVYFIRLLFDVYLILILARILGSWVPELRYTTWMQFVCAYTDPYLNFFKSFIPPLGMLDLSPIFALLALNFGKQFITYLLI